MLKRERDGPKVRTPSIKNETGKVVHEVNEILEVWRLHFSKLGTPVESPNFDEVHYNNVNGILSELMEGSDVDPFTQEHISIREVIDGISKLNSGKAAGFDNITKEHIFYAGPSMSRILSLLFNWILDTEYIPINFRRGVQIPLYKGKNTSIFDVNNYNSVEYFLIN